MGSSSRRRVEPVDPLEGGVLDGFEAAPRSSPVDHLGFVEVVDRLGQSVVVTVANAADRGLDPGLGEALGVLDRHALRSAIAVVNPAATMNRPAILKRLLERIQHETGMCRPAGAPADDPAGIGIDDEACPERSRRGNVDEPCPGGDVEPAPAKAGVKSDTNSIFGAGA